MKAIIYDDVKKVRLGDIPMPTPGKDEVLVKVLRVGVCGSDLNMLRGIIPIQPGAVLGHEILGMRMDTGEKVVVNPLIYCGKCRPCRMGKGNICDHGAFFGDGTAPGGFTEYITVRIDRLINVSDVDIPDETLVLAEPLAVGLRASQCAPLTEGPVAVVGAGIIGQATIFALKRRGLRRITAVDPVADRLPIAMQMGATDTAAKLTDTGYEAIYDCVGSAETRSTLLDHVMSGGTMVSVGAYSREFAFRSTPIARFGKTLTGTFGYVDGNLTEAIYTSAELKDLSWCRTVSLSDGVEALTEMLEGKAPATQLKLVFRND